MTIKRYLDLQGLKTYDNSIKSYIKDLADVEAYNSLTDFPTKGKFDVLYISTSTKALYIWSADGYYRIGLSQDVVDKLEIAYTHAMIAYEHANIVDGSNPHNTTYSNIVNTPNIATLDDIDSIINS